MEKPQQIIRFATFALVASLINFTATAVLTQFTTRGLVGAAIGVFIVVGLVAWIIKGRSAIGRLILTVWLAFGVGASLATYVYMLVAHHTDLMGPGVQTLSLVTTAANIAALIFLWSSASSEWLRKQPEPSEQP